MPKIRSVRSGVGFLASLAAVLSSLTFVPGAHAETPEPSNVVSFEVQVSREVANDVMRATVSAQKEDRDAANAADAVNRLVTAGLERAKKFPAIRAQTAGYHTYPVYDKTRIAQWRAQSDIRIESHDFSQMSRLLGQLQETMQISNLEFVVSPASRSAAEQGLTVDAINAFRQRAEVIRTAYKADSYRIRQMDIRNADNGGIIRPQRMAVMEMAAKSVAPPPAEPGSSLLTTSISGSIQLK